MSPGHHPTQMEMSQAVPKATPPTAGTGLRRHGASDAILPCHRQRQDNE